MKTSRDPIIIDKKRYRIVDEDEEHEPKGKLYLQAISIPYAIVEEFFSKVKLDVALQYPTPYVIGGDWVAWGIGKFFSFFSTADEKSWGLCLEPYDEEILSAPKNCSLNQLAKFILKKEGRAPKNQEKQYVQIVIASGAKRHELLSYLNEHNLTILTKTLPPDGLGVMGAGPFFPSLKLAEVECRCTDIHEDILRSHRVQESLDLTPIVDFFRLGGTEHGSSSYRS